MNRLNNIIFDFDGVIADSGELIYDLSKNCDPSLTREKFINHSCGNVFEKPKIDYETKGVDFFFKKYSEWLNVEHLKKSLVYIKQLGEMYNLFIISSNVEIVMKRVLTESGIGNLFVEVLGYESHTSKVQKFKMLEKKHGITTTNSVFITDTLGDIREANELGYTTIAETFGIHNRILLEKGKPYKIVDTWEEIILEIKKIK